MRLDGVPRAIAWCAFGSVCLAPFLFGAVERSVWIPLCQLWLGAGLASALLRARVQGRGVGVPLDVALSKTLLPVHALICAQLIPLPAAVLRALSPGSFTAHFLPDPGDGRFRPLSVSPSATVEAWLYFAGLQGLFLALQGIPDSRRRAALHALLGMIVVLAAEGLWQSRSAHPSWLYTRVPIIAPLGLESATFGPYYNRNHFATVMAMGAGWAAGLAMALTRRRGGLTRLVTNTEVLTGAILLIGASILLTLTSAASGSRSGALAAVAAIAMVVGRGVGLRLVLIPLGLGLAALLLSGAAAIERLTHLDILASRWAPWMDMTNLLRFFPLFGSGLGTFRAAYWPYQMNAPYEFWLHAHNEYLQWAIEAGVAGVIVLFLTQRAMRRSVTFADDLREPAIGALAAVAVQACFDFPIRIPANAAVIVCMLSLALAPRSDR